MLNPTGSREADNVGQRLLPGREKKTFPGPAHLAFPAGHYDVAPCALDQNDPVKL